MLKYLFGKPDRFAALEREVARLEQKVNERNTERAEIQREKELNAKLADLRQELGIVPDLRF
jgi:cell shape-determining protein MreC